MNNLFLFYELTTDRYKYFEVIEFDFLAFPNLDYVHGMVCNILSLQ